MEPLKELTICYFVENGLTEFEFYALFTQDREFQIWFLGHAIQHNDCPRCRAFLNKRHLVAEKKDFWDTMDTLLISAKRQLHDFRQVTA
ncbi:MAG TPA: hypothetical protein VIJ29_00120 [Candidatus Paceibacterota bacterium]